MPSTLLHNLPKAPAAFDAIATQEDRDRRADYATLADFWNGVQWVRDKNRSNTRPLVLNYARSLLRKAAAYTLAEPVLHTIPAIDGLSEETAGAIEKQLNAALDAAGAHSLDYQTLIDASLYGEGAVKVTWNDDAGRLQLAGVHPNQMLVWADPAARDVPLRLMHGYYVLGSQIAEHFGISPQLTAALSPTSAYPVVEEWTPAEWRVTVNEQELHRAPNPYGWVPYALIINEPETGRQWGRSDIDDLMPIFQELNRRVATVNTILEFSGAPIAVIEGVTGTDGLASKPGAMWELPENAKAYLLDLLQSGGVRLHIEQIGELRTSIHEISETPKTAFGDTGRTISGAALEVEIQPLVQKVRRKRGSLTAFYRRRNAMALALLNRYAECAGGWDTATVPVYPPILPSDAEAEARRLAQLVASGIRSRRSAAADLGETDPEREFERWIEEIERSTPEPAESAETPTSQNSTDDAAPDDAGDEGAE